MRIKLTWVLALEAALFLACLSLARFVPGTRDWSGFLAGFWFVCLVMQAPLVLLKGWNFVVYDVEPESSIKYYWFVVIGVAAFMGEIVKDLLFS